MYCSWPTRSLIAGPAGFTFPLYSYIFVC